jgi:glycosyltransferase involved in cell wall biosynthesis
MQSQDKITNVDSKSSDITLQHLVDTHTSTRAIAEQTRKIIDLKISEKNAAINAAIERRKDKFLPDLIDTYSLSGESDAGDKRKVCLVTDELSSIGPSGGIGAAFLELARVLANDSRIELTLLYTNFWVASDPVIGLKLKELGVELDAKVVILDPGHYVSPPFDPHKISYSVLHYLEEQVLSKGLRPWDVIHFHDYKGIGYFTALRNRQKPGHIANAIIVQAHGTSRWAVELNGRFFSDEAQLIVDYLESKSLEYCDMVVSPSQYLLDWFDSKGLVIAANRSQGRKVIQNIRVSQTAAISDYLGANNIEEIVFFGRHEARKGLPIFVEAINTIIRENKTNIPAITILGGLGTIGEVPSLLYLENATKDWNGINFRLILDFNRDQSLSYLSERAHSKLVCICSPAENSPYTLVEAIQSGCMLICSQQGGGKEIVNDAGFSGIIEMTPPVLAGAIKNALANPLEYVPAFCFEDSDLRSQWLDLHFAPNLIQSSQLKSGQINSEFHQRIAQDDLPLVSFIITHYERPEKLSEALSSVLLQTYPNIQIIVVDDGSRSSQTVDYLEMTIQPLLRLCKGKLVYRENGYLGAARNTGLRSAEGEYVIFMDDDDIALPELVTTLVEAATNHPTDVTIALNAYMPLSDRDQLREARFTSCPIPSYVPAGNIKSLTPLHNVLGACTSLIKLDKVRAIGGYSELRDVGHEDYELYVKMSQAGHTFQICPKVLYLYETQRPSMLSKTTLWMNYERSIKAHNLPKEIEDLVLCFKGQYIEKIRPSRLSWILQDESLGSYVDDWLRPDKAVPYILERLQKSGCNPALMNAIKRDK